LSIHRGVSTIDALTRKIYQQVRALKKVGDRRRVTPEGIRSPTADELDQGTLSPELPREVPADESGCSGDHNSIGGESLGHLAFSIL